MATTLAAHLLDALRTALWLSLPVLAAAWLTGLLAAGFGHLTRLGDATTSSVPRQLVVAVTLGVAGTWAWSELLALTSRLWAALELASGA